MDTCRCEVSFLTLAHARPRPITCGWCGGSWINTTSKAPYVLTDDAASRTTAWLRACGEIALVWDTGHVVYVTPEDVVRAPGRARLEPCARAAAGGLRCVDCDGTGYRVWHVCVACGDEAMWEYTDDDRSEMTCRVRGAEWPADDPRWLAQRVPAWMLATDATGRCAIPASC